MGGDRELLFPTSRRSIRRVVTSSGETSREAERETGLDGDVCAGEREKSRLLMLQKRCCRLVPDPVDDDTARQNKLPVKKAEICSFLL